MWSIWALFCHVFSNIGSFDRGILYKGNLNIANFILIFIGKLVMDTQTATRGVLLKKVFLEISQNSQETPVPGSFFNKVAWGLAQMFSCEFYKIFENTFFTEHLWTTASADNTNVAKKSVRKDLKYFLSVFPCAWTPYQRFVNEKKFQRKKVCSCFYEVNESYYHIFDTFLFHPENGRLSLLRTKFGTKISNIWKTGSNLCSLLIASSTSKFF